MLLNTSLNVAGKPIAGKFEDALELYHNSLIDAMVIVNKILIKNTWQHPNFVLLYT